MVPPRPARMSRSSMTNQPAPGADGYRRSKAKPSAGCVACALVEPSRSAAQRAHFRSELGMDLHSGHVNRTGAVRVVARVPEQLVTRGQPDRLQEIDTVERLDEPFGSAAKMTVTDEAVDAAHGQVPRMRVGDEAHREAEPRHVERTMPEGP